MFCVNVMLYSMSLGQQDKWNNIRCGKTVALACLLVKWIILLLDSDQVSSE